MSPILDLEHLHILEIWCGEYTHQYTEYVESEYENIPCFDAPQGMALHLHYTTTRAQEKIHLAKKSGTFSTRVSTTLPANIQLR